MASAKFLALLASPNASRRYLVIIQGYDPSLGGVQSYYFGDPGAGRPYISDPGDSPGNTIFEPRLRAEESFRFTRSMFVPGSQDVRGGRSFPGIGAIVLDNLDGELDGFKSIGFDGRAITVLMGGEDFAYAEHEVIFRGTVDGLPEVSTDRVVFQVRDRQAELDKPVQADLFAGTGGIEGGPDLTDQPKPIALGIVRNIEPIPLGIIGGLPSYRFNDDAVEAFDVSLHMAYDAGIGLVRSVGSPPSAGEFTIDAATGVLTIYSPPAGRITLDAWGAAGVATLADAIEYLVTVYGGVSPADLDTAAFTALAAALPGPIGAWIPAGGNLLDILDALCGPLGVFYGFNRAGEFTVAQLDEASGSPALSLTEDEILDLLRLQSELPIWRQTIGYARSQVVQDGTDLTAAYQNTVTNGTFATASDWTLGAGFSISGGLLVATAGSSSSATQDQTLVAGMSYALTFDVPTWTAGNVQPRIEGVDLGAAITAPGSYRRDFVAQGAAAQTLEFLKNAAGAGAIDNVVLVPSRLEFVRQSYRTVTVDDPTVKTVHLLAGENRQDTCLDDASDAAAEAARQLDLHGTRRDVYRVRAKVQPFAVDLNDVVSIQDSRFGLSAGQIGRVVEIEENAARNEVVLTVWC